MVSLIDIQMEVVKKLKEMRRSYLKYAKIIKDLAEETFSNLIDVYVFGSVVRGEEHAMSDVDIAVVLKEPVSEEERVAFYRKIREKIGSLHPFEIHVISKEEWENWYRKFVKEDFVRVK
ncbi:DNA polymerase beta domain protein region [Ferroglobus placidus DSM 10642]|uniref:DNA polymerase beta domain protein region n=1 Tax=Ferroglobus placidus (strain DSM 10642 / AEDII12DO) TaxID=589924 RepID=D3S1F5_FERPA|nr:nucleotidyltransferase domain-containing protein [Ferroglobus placidus]ADC66419.1 DNA polymerase beta domain protein region [Ferroglobus placidus DSM 10642]